MTKGLAATVILRWDSRKKGRIASWRISQSPFLSLPYMHPGNIFLFHITHPRGSKDSKWHKSETENSRCLLGRLENHVAGGMMVRRERGDQEQKGQRWRVWEALWAASQSWVPMSRNMLYPQKTLQMSPHPPDPNIDKHCKQRCGA
jgi:hypothetical protein